VIAHDTDEAVHPGAVLLDLQTGSGVGAYGSGCSTTLPHATIRRPNAINFIMPIVTRQSSRKFPLPA
jgi:hypothetical protein